MGKIDDVELKGYSQELLDFKDDLINVINYGKYQNASTKSTPSWTGTLGETMYVVPDTGGISTWVWVGTAWLATTSRI